MEDLALFNGQLLDYGSPAEVTPYEGLKDDGSFIQEAVYSPSGKTSVYETLAHPQNGSQDLGLQDLLTETPQRDLQDPYPASPEWLDKQADLVSIEKATDFVDMLTGVDTSLQGNVQHIVIEGPAIPQEILDVSEFLLPDLPAAIPPQPAQDPSVPVMTHDAATLPFSTTDEHMDYLDSLNQAGLEMLLADAPDPTTASLFDAPILSPVSVDEVESVLSVTSNPPSPSQDLTLSSLFSSFSSGQSTVESSTLDEEQVGQVLGEEPQRTSRVKARPAPYPVLTPSPSPPPQTSRKPKADRKERKKAQNRTAALRYREKKRSEQDVLQQEADELAEKNDKLRDKVDSISREIKYLKDLMAEVEKARSTKAKKGASSKQFHIAIP